MDLSHFSEFVVNLWAVQPDDRPLLPVFRLRWTLMSRPRIS